jgi:phage pi2 protein 07
MVEKNNLIKVDVDDEEVRKLFVEKLEERIKEIEVDVLFWNMKELCRQTSMSENNVKDKFFYDPRFSKYKVGAKWVIPAAEAKSFLLDWIKEQPKY